ncbi:MAG: hypothetical protein ABL308_12285 [Oceanicaulis sp.]
MATQFLKPLTVAVGAAFLLSGCLTLPDGAETASVTVSDFNQAIADSRNEQILLNLVRLRYRDTSQFMRVLNVSDAQTYSIEAEAATNLSFIGRALSGVGLGATASAERKPVVSMSPMDDAEFATALLTPLTTADLALLASSGWSIERILLCCVERVGALSNSPRASGPTPAEVPDNAAFRAFAEEVRALQREEALSLIFDGERTSLVFFGDGVDVPPALTSQLGVDIVDDRVPLRSVSETGETGVPVQTRSILGTLYALSHAVDVPPAHAQAGLVTNAYPLSPSTPDWETYLSGAFKVHSGRERPDSAFVSVFYRGHWFWIDDADLNSKTTFNLVDYLIRLKSASGGAAPLLTLGLN